MDACWQAFQIALHGLPVLQSVAPPVTTNNSSDDCKHHGEEALRRLSAMTTSTGSLVRMSRTRSAVDCRTGPADCLEGSSSPVATPKATRKPRRKIPNAVKPKMPAANELRPTIAVWKTVPRRCAG
eukprot:CAMPEP_0115437356 /NCGR_PEP_ID=MMETSP0271-20121206/34692_1 /TAXON_ID=71861 /ORGANISM="Scrippsiella trochoidea, Strain CCMP3099" /LENGTH=125 /DNA_ID=CAMNT_0002862961 /DNA_START=199 /DNA_END=576 /DNA_ORIENTATION=-